MEDGTVRSHAEEVGEGGARRGNGAGAGGAAGAVVVRSRAEVLRAGGGRTWGVWGTALGLELAKGPGGSKQRREGGPTGRKVAERVGGSRRKAELGPGKGGETMARPIEGGCNAGDC